MATTLFTRPWPLRLIALAYLIGPVANVLQASIRSGASASSVVAHALAGFGAVGAALALSAPIVGVGVYSGAKWGYVLFFGHSGAVLVDSLVKLLRGGGLYHSGILLADLVVFAAVFVMLRGDMRAPFLSAIRRGWRIHPRWAAAADVTVSWSQSQKIVQLVDLSVKGFAAQWTGEPLPVGLTVRIRFHDVPRWIDAQVVQGRPGALSCCFAGLAEHELEWVLERVSPASRPA